MTERQRVPTGVSIRSRDRSPGRQEPSPTVVPRRQGFNSLPGPEPRETCVRPHAGSVSTEEVSIRSRDRSPGRLISRGVRYPSGQFQSAPGTGAPGDCPEPADWGRRLPVSIRSRDRSPGRHRVCLAGARPQGVAIRSRDRSPGRHRHPHPGRPADRFNPLPGPEPRETRSRPRLPPLPTRFNPLRGPEPRETTVHKREGDSFSEVSIRSRDRSPGRPGEPSFVYQACTGFNPLPGPEPRETAWWSGGSRGGHGFQSAPGTGAPGDPFGHAGFVAGPAVSIRSRDRSPGRPCSSASPRTRPCRFNPLPGPEPRETRPVGQLAERDRVSIRSRDRSPGRPDRNRRRGLSYRPFQSAPGTGAPGDRRG